MILKVLQIDNPLKKIFVFKDTEKEAIVDLDNETYSMIPFGTLLLELLNNKEKIIQIIENAYTSDIEKLTPYDNYLYSLIELCGKEIRQSYRIENPDDIPIDDDLKEVAIEMYLDNVEMFIEAFVNKKGFTYIKTPGCITLRASEFVIPFSRNLQKDSYLTVYSYKSIVDIFGVYSKLFYENKIYINKCKNCGKYFLPLHKSNETLCNNIYKNGKTCKQLSGELKLINDDILSIYRTAYKRENGKKNRYRHIPNIQLKFENWNKTAKEKYTDCKRGLISKEELSEWLDSSRDWFKD